MLHFLFNKKCLPSIKLLRRFDHTLWICCSFYELLLKKLLIKPFNKTETILWCQGILLIGQGWLSGFGVHYKNEGNGLIPMRLFEKQGAIFLSELCGHAVKAPSDSPALENNHGIPPTAFFQRFQARSKHWHR